MQDGVSTKFGKDNGTWCCKTTKDECIRDGGNMICNGTVLSLTDQCHDENYDGPSCNYYPLDENRYIQERNYDTVHRSFLDLCQDNKYAQHFKSASAKNFLKNVFSFQYLC